MNNDITVEMVMKEKVYSTKEIADYLSIADSTVRKWCLLLEEHGYNFRRNEFQKREYVEHDVIALHKFKDLTKDGAMSLEDAAIAVSSNYSRVPNNAIAMPDTKENKRYDERYMRVLEDKVDALTEMMDRQLQFNEALMKKMDEQQKLFSERMELSDQRLVEAMKMINNTQKELAAAKAPEPPKGFLQRLLGK
ncbi:hypothetical protein GPJ61_27795 [Brevibacillus formosus]|uniref:hypothetical protein n=1 Tax=Brevibacillus formosus TaxID=54913 RepID=UPI001CA591F4|nr:hypothetical protein [Brevibacillus formosus]MBW5471594.1 hypothetical protein [Brevibacillus formosus]